MPASVDSIVSSNGQEDHVSMGANAAVKLIQIVKNVETILAIELLCAAQALHFRRPMKTSNFLEELVADFRHQVPLLDNDRMLSTDINKAKEFIRQRF
jgi:histidine ammonia-lyase